MAAGFDTTGQGALEIRPMVEEKIAAAHEGALAAQMAWGSFLDQGGRRSAGSEGRSLGVCLVGRASPLSMTLGRPQRERPGSLPPLLCVGR